MEHWEGPKQALNYTWARPKKGVKKCVKIKIFGPFFLGFSPEIDPRTP